MKEFNQLNGNEAAAYYNEFGVIPTSNVNSSFSPPISMYQALLIALENEGLEQNIAHRFSVSAYLMKDETATNNTLPGTNIINSIIPVTKPPANYSDVYRNGMIYQYIWEIAVGNATGIRHPLGFTVIDASTGQILPNPSIW